MKKIVILLLISCVVPCLFVIPIFCEPQEVTLSEKEDFCPILSFAVTSNTLILAEPVTYISVPEGYTILKDIPQVITLPVFHSVKDKPPKTLSFSI